MPTIYDVAKLAKVSPATVSRVLNGHPQVSTRVQVAVRAAMEEAGYPPAGRRRSRHAHVLLGLVLNDVSSEFYCEVLRGVEDAAAIAEAGLVLYPRRGQPFEQALDRLTATRHLDGAIVVTPPSAELVISRLPRDLPCVLLDYRAADRRVPAISVDNLRGAHDATSLLIAQGHRRIGLLSGPTHIQSALDRLRGYRLALAEAGLPYVPELVRNGDFTEPSGYAVVKAWLGEEAPFPDALFAGNDLTAFGALRALTEAGRSVPGDVALVGFDDLPLASMVSPALTTVAQPLREMGAMAVGMLLRLAAGERLDAPEVILPARLQVRSSH